MPSLHLAVAPAGTDEAVVGGIVGVVTVGGVAVVGGVVVVVLVVGVAGALVVATGLGAVVEGDLLLDELPQPVATRTTTATSAAASLDRICTPSAGREEGPGIPDRCRPRSRSTLFRSTTGTGGLQRDRWPTCPLAAVVVCPAVWPRLEMELAREPAVRLLAAPGSRLLGWPEGRGGRVLPGVP